LSNTSRWVAHSPKIPSKLKLRGSSTLLADDGVTGREEVEGVVRDGVEDDRVEEGVVVEEEGREEDTAGEAFVLRERDEERGVLRELEAVATGVGGGVSASMVEMQFLSNEEIDCG
jgi:hypothetical protein